MRSYFGFSTKQAKPLPGMFKCTIYSRQRQHASGNAPKKIMPEPDLASKKRSIPSKDSMKLHSLKKELVIADGNLIVGSFPQPNVLQYSCAMSDIQLFLQLDEKYAAKVLTCGGIYFRCLGYQLDAKCFQHLYADTCWQMP